MRHGLRLMVYDRTCLDRPWLTPAWVVGAALAQARGALDASFAASTWNEALGWLADYGEGMPIAEVQYWGHGKWGEIKVDREGLNIGSLRPGHEHHRHLEAIRERMSEGSQWWFRTCEAFGAHVGHRFAQEWTDFFGCPAAGHTYIIGPWQSGLHYLRPGMRPTWSPDEGIVKGDANNPQKAAWSQPWRARTVNCLAMQIPPALTV